MQRKFRVLRKQAYEYGRQSFETLSSGDPTFRDFVCMYIGEGYKRSRNQVCVANSDPRVIVLATRRLRAMSRNTLVFSVQYHADQDPRQLSEFWASTLGSGDDQRHAAARTTPSMDGLRAGSVVTLACQRGVAQSGQSARFGAERISPVRIRPPRLAQVSCGKGNPP
jgi:hypothetical protein